MAPLRVGCAVDRGSAHFFAEDALKDHTAMALHVTAESERDLCEMGIGAHVSQSRCHSLFLIFRLLSRRCNYSFARSRPGACYFRDALGGVVEGARHDPQHAFLG